MSRTEDQNGAREWRTRQHVDVSVCAQARLQCCWSRFSWHVALLGVVRLSFGLVGVATSAVVGALADHRQSKDIKCLTPHPVAKKKRSCFVFVAKSATPDVHTMSPTDCTARSSSCVAPSAMPLRIAPVSNTFLATICGYDRGLYTVCPGVRVVEGQRGGYRRRAFASHAADARAGAR